LAAGNCSADKKAFPRGEGFFVSLSKNDFLSNSLDAR
jgi:hypothetical protein